MNYQNRSSEYSSNSLISLQNLEIFQGWWDGRGFLQSAGREKDEILQKVIDQKRVEMAEGKLCRTVEICWCEWSQPD